MSLLFRILALTCLFNFTASIEASSNPEDCASCHQSAVSNWQQSDHAKAMEVATSKSVLGNFDDAKVAHFTQQAHFYKKGDKFLIKFTEQDKTTEYQVKYTFGHYPLQQYLIEHDNGRMQVFPFAWDSQPKSLGGQRWYPIYADEDIKPNDRLHWQQPLQNWNGMCADCHSDGLKRKYDIKQDAFDTHWDNINVGCQSCHGKMPDHATKYAKGANTLNLSNAEKQQVMGWLLEPGEKVAKWQGEKRDNQFMETCFACHSLRSPLTDGIEPGTRFLDQFSPSLLAPPLYHADGQIKEEVYVYGSFLQSKMFEAGVNCLDCHDQHTMKIKSQNNGLCLQCHNAEVYHQESHTKHPLDSDAGMCVNCHMPETTYMGVDARRDHSFRIPRPDLSEQFNTPNACTNCHQDKDNKWAKTNLKNWFGEPENLTSGEATYLQLMHTMNLPLEKHLELINDDDMPEIKRASALLLLPNTTNYLTDAFAQQWINSELPLIRLAMAQIGNLLSEDERQLTFAKLLDDEFKAIRAAAANNLLTTGITKTDVFKRAFTELTAANQTTSWRGEGNLNRSLVSMNLQQPQASVDALNHAIKVDPYFEPAYVNLADMHRINGNSELEKATFEKALKALPRSASLNYSKGLHSIRSGDKAGSIKYFTQAVKLDNRNPQHAYLYFLALDSIGQTKKALSELNRVYNRYQGNRQLAELGASFAQKLGDRAMYNRFIKLLN